MKTVNSFTLQPGAYIDFGGALAGEITKIDMIEYDTFRVSLDEHDPSIGFDVDTRGFNRVKADIVAVAELPITAYDLVTIDGVGTRCVWSINEIRPKRYQFRLTKKFDADLVVDVVGSGSES